MMIIMRVVMIMRGDDDGDSEEGVKEDGEEEEEEEENEDEEESDGDEIDSDEEEEDEEVTKEKEEESSMGVKVGTMTKLDDDHDQKMLEDEEYKLRVMMIKKKHRGCTGR